MKTTAGLICLFFLTTGVVFAGGPGKGTITVHPQGAVSSLSVRYNISQLMQEPVINGEYKWESATLKRLDSDVVVWLKISNTRGSGYLLIDSTVPEKGKWSFNAAGSPNWDKTIVLEWSGSKAIRYADAATAKAFWKAGFAVTGAFLSKDY